MEASMTSQSDSEHFNCHTNGSINGEEANSVDSTNPSLDQNLNGEKLVEEITESNNQNSDQKELANINSFETLNHTKIHVNNDVINKLSDLENSNVEENNIEARSSHIFSLISSEAEPNILEVCHNNENGETVSESNNLEMNHIGDDIDKTTSESQIPINGAAVGDNFHLSESNDENSSSVNCKHDQTLIFNDVNKNVDSTLYENEVICESDTFEDSSEEIPVTSVKDLENINADVSENITSTLEEEEQISSKNVENEMICNNIDKEKLSPLSDITESASHEYVKELAISSDSQNETSNDKFSDSVTGDDSNSLPHSSQADANDMLEKVVLPQGMSELNEMLCALSFSEKNEQEILCKTDQTIECNDGSSKTTGEEIEVNTKPDNTSNSSHCSDDDSLNFNLQEMCNKNRSTENSPSLDAENLLEMAHALPSEIEKNLYDTSLGLEDIINAAVSEIALEFNKEGEGFLSIDSDSNLVTASEGVISSCSPSTSSENSQQVSESSNANCQVGSLQEMSQHSSLEENHDFEDKEVFGKRGDADGCSLSSEPSKVSGSASEDKAPFISKLEVGEAILQTQEDDSSNCSCKRVEVRPYEENGSVLLGAWSELRSSLRQLHRSVIPSSLSKSGLCNPRNRPSVNRIKALSNMLFAHDPHQLFTRVNQLNQELCIELKVRLLSTIHDSPDVEEALMFIKGLCESYEWVINVCETIQPAFEKLDSDHLSRFGLNWMTINMHTFHATIFTDPDVQEYLSLCCAKIPKAEDGAEGKEILGCLASLKRTLSVAETVWARGENHLQEYAVERAALNAQRRQFLSGWEQIKSRQSVYGKFPGQTFPLSSHSSLDKDVTECSAVETSSTQEDQSQQQCPCTDCHKSGSKGHHNPSSLPPKTLALDSSSKDATKSCECHFCNSSVAHSQPSNAVLSVSNNGVLPPLSQPQLSLYPHIHGTSASSDITSNQVIDELGPLPTVITSKPPIFANPYLGSDLLTEQLIREWDLAYGDALTPPGIQPITSVSTASISDASELTRHLENLSLASQVAPPMSHSGGTDRTPTLSTQDSHSCVHMTQEKPPMRLSVSSGVAASKSHVTESSANHPVSGNAKYQKEPLQKMLIQKKQQQPLPQHQQQKQQQQHHHQQQQQQQQQQQHHQQQQSQQQAPQRLPQGPPNSSVITHTKNCTGVPISQPPRKPASSESDSSDHEDWSSDDESDAFSTSSSTNHKDSHCDCCYCHMLQNKPGGGRQKYSDRRERLLKILSHKRRASSMASAPTASSAPSTTSSLPPSSAGTNGPKTPNDSQIGRQTLDEIINYIEGKRTNNAKCHKKAAKKARQKERKLAMKKQEEKRKKEDDRYNNDEEPDADDNGCYGDESEGNEEEEEEEDGPLAELRRRAPDVTITVVKPGQKTASNQRAVPKQQMNVSREQHPIPSSAGKHPLVSKPAAPQPTSLANSWNSPRPVLPSGRLSSMPMTSSSVPKGPMGGGGGPKESGTPVPTSSSTGGLSSLLKGMEVLSKDQSADKDGKSSQMVTIRRVMDPISSEPTVTITLKGEEPKKDKVLFKLVNGQACPGNGANASNPAQPAKPKKKPQEQPVYNIPEGTSPEEALKMKKRMKRERQKQRKEQEKLEEQQREQMKQLEIQKRQEFLKQQEAHIRKQQAALEREQQELLRQQTKGQNEPVKKKGKKGKTTNDNHSKDSGKGKNVSALVYDGDDVARNFSLPPGVSINKVAGQPGMVTISNNMGNPFPQPFLPNPNLYQNNILPGYPVGSHGSNSGYPLGSGGSMGYSGMYGGCGGPVPWSGGIDPCTGTPQESVIVVDTNAGATSTKGLHSQDNTSFKGNSSSSSQRYKKKAEEMTSEEKIEAAVRGELDVSYLNQTQKKKYKKCLKMIKQEEETAIQKQREEDELMDRMYEMAKGRVPKSSKEESNHNKSKSAKKNVKGKDNSKVSIQSHLNNAGSNASSYKQAQAKNDKNLSKKQKQTQSNASTLTQTKHSNNQSTLKTKMSSSTNTKKGNDNNKNSLKAEVKGQQESRLQQSQQSHVKSKTYQKQPQPQQQQKQQQQPVKQQSSHAHNQHSQKQQQQKSSQNLQQQQQQQKQQQQKIAHQSIQQKQQHQQQQLQSVKKNPKSTPHQQSQTVRHSQAEQVQNKTQQTSTRKQKHTQQVLQVQHQQQQQHQAKKQASGHHIQDKKQGIHKHNSMTNSNFNSMRLQSNFKGNLGSGDNPNMYPPQMPYEVGSYGPSIGYANNDYGHEARYAQYLAANASTLASMEYETNNLSAQHGLIGEENIRKKGKKKGKRGHLEDLTTIDSVFTPKELPSGELDDETDREVEAFKRFCLYNVPRSTGEKPKVNFNVKDIMIKKKH